MNVQKKRLVPRLPVFVGIAAFVTCVSPALAQEQAHSDPPIDPSGEVEKEDEVSGPSEDGTLEEASESQDEPDADSWPVPDPPQSEKAVPVITIARPLTAAPAISIAESRRFDVSEKGQRRLVLPSQRVEVGIEMAFLTSAPLLTEQATQFSDVGLLRLRARRSFSDRVEGYVHTQVLAKQPSTTDEPVWQSGGLGVRAEVLDTFALGLGGNTGLLLGGSGMWWQAAPGVLFKPEVGRYTRFLLGAGGLFTMLHFSDADSPFWLQELAAQAEIQVGDNRSRMWVGVNYAVPLASAPSSAQADAVRGYIDPQVRLGLDVGGALSLDNSNWDVYAVFSVIDRGDIDDAATTLPILDGGFDQHQIAIGTQHRFGGETRKRRLR